MQNKTEISKERKDRLHLPLVRRELSHAIWRNETTGNYLYITKLHGKTNKQQFSVKNYPKAYLIT